MFEENTKPRKITGMTSPQPMVMSGNLAQQWKKWVQSFKFYLRASGLEEQSDGRKVALLLHAIGEKGVDIFNTLDKDEDQIKYDELIKLFQNHFDPKANLTYECYNFFTYKQAESETLEDFAESLKLKSQSCELGTLQERLIKVMFICNMHQKYNYIKEKLLLEDKLNLDQALEMAKAMLAFRHQTDELTAEQRSVLYNTSRQSRSRSKSNSKNVSQYSQQAREEVSTKCDQVHQYKCPAIGMKCKEREKVKEEPEWGECSVSEAAAAEGLYAGHEVKDELVIGPELMQQQDIAFSIHNKLTVNKKNPLRLEADGASDPPGCSPGDGPRCDRSTEQQHGLRTCFTWLEGPVENQNISMPFYVSIDCELRHEVNCQPQLGHNLATSHTDLLVQTDINEKQLSCNICCKKFSEQIELTRHLLTHTAKNLYCCDVCSKQFADKRMLIKHIRKHLGEKRYSCNLCNKWYKEKSMLDQHTRLHTDERPYCCDVCYKSFKFKTTLIYHKLIHTGEKPSCDVCNKRFNTKGDLNAHKRMHTRVQRSCNVCNKRFASNSDLAVQKLIHADEKPYHCDACNKLLSSKETLAAHKQMHTDKLTINKENPLEPTASGADAPPGCSQTCPGAGPRCNRSTEQQHGLRTCFIRLEQLPDLLVKTEIHEQVLFCKICCKQFSTQTELTRHVLTHTAEDVYYCDVCSKQFTTKTALSNHKLIHTGEKPYSCHVCNKQFRLKDTLKNHLRVHTGEKPYGCVVCGQRFTQQPHLALHFRCHTGEKPYMCDICKKRFRKKSALTEHERLHTGEKPYSCLVCNKRFRLAAWYKHKRIHSVENEKACSCEVCNKPFRNKIALKRHLQLHTRGSERPYGCDVCGQRFKDRPNLTRHIKCHTGEKPYVCNVCKKRFREKTTLTEHERLHTGEKPYSCVVCNKRFRQRAAWSAHKRIHTDE